MMDFRIYCFGDAKTIENMAKFMRDMQNFHIYFDEVSLQADVFLDTMSIAICVPGDWHAGLCMLQSIFTPLYEGLIKPFQRFLGWKHVNSDVHSCYFREVRLLTFTMHN